MLDLGRCLYLDFEAKSEVNIDDVGARAYAEHPTTELLCCGWAVGLDAPVEMWLPGEPLPLEWMLHDYRWVAHNKDTERFLLEFKMDTVVLPELWVDSATVASAAGMPRNLHDVGLSLQLKVQKQERTALLALAKPRKLSKKNSEKWWTKEQKPDLYRDLYEYCRTDVDVMRKSMAALPNYHWVMPLKEERLAVLTDKMNDRGVEVDLIGVAKAHAVVEKHGAQLRARFAELYPDVNPRHAPSVAKALGLENARKETVRDALKELTGEFGIHPTLTHYFEALTLLKTIKTASTAKLAAFLKRALRGRIHGAMVFHGAGRTGRWSSMGVQLHNLVRGLGAGTPDWPAIDTSDDAMDTFFEMLHAELLDIAYKDVTRATAAAMRGFLLDSKDGLLMGDFSQIEARVLVAWARQTDMVEAFRQKRDPYVLFASRIYGRTITKADTDERFMGKQGVLGCGYGVGKHGFRAMLKEIYDVDISIEEAERIVHVYRTSNQRVVNLWYAVERLAKQTLLEQPQKMICSTEVPLIAMRMVDKWLVIRLPSGRCLWYFEPELQMDDGRSRIYYWGRNPKIGGRWDRVETYGGKLVENVTQAIARDVMADAMLRLEERNFPVQMTVHDEIIAPGPGERLDEFKSIMLRPPAWWLDLPIDVEVQHKRRYQK